MSNRRNFREYLTVAVPSVLVFLLGLGGVLGLTRSDWGETFKRRTHLVRENFRLKDDIFKELRTAGYLSADERQRTEEAKRKIARAQREIDAFPEGESGRRDRNRVYSGKLVPAQELLRELRDESVARYLADADANQHNADARQYLENTRRIDEINRKGWVYSKEMEVVYVLTGFLLNVIMCLGFLATLLFGVFGFVGWLGTLE